MYLFSSHAFIRKALALSTCALGLSGLLTACDSQKAHQESQNNAVYQEEHAVATSAEIAVSDEASTVQAVEPKEEAGRKLTEIAGQASLPSEKHLHRKDDVIDKEDLKYVGRYSTKIPCKDAFARCEKGQAEYILSLLADGTAHRTVVNLGRMYSDKAQKNGEPFYRQDTWSYDEEHGEIVIHFVEGHNFYYKVIDANHLVIHLDKNQQEEYVDNFDLDGQNYPQPEKAYVLKKTND